LPQSIPERFYYKNVSTNTNQNSLSIIFLHHLLRYLNQICNATRYNYNTGSTDSAELCRKLRYFYADDQRFYQLFKRFYMFRRFNVFNFFSFLSNGFYIYGACQNIERHIVSIEGSMHPVNIIHTIKYYLYNLQLCDLTGLFVWQHAKQFYKNF